MTTKLTSTSERQPQSPSAAEKQRQLQEALAELPSVIIALSGGTDSAYLAWVAHQVLGASGQRPATSEAPGTGRQRLLAVTAVSASLPERERAEVERFVHRYAIPHEFIRTEELQNPLYVANHPDRCYHCKDELFDKLGALARERGIAAVAYGVNLDDLADFRPGQQAAREHRILTPLLDAGLTKAEIRRLSRRAGLPTWSKPAAACLASRLAPGIEVTDENLKKIERGEEALRKLGFRQVRVRYH
ncbi:MAG: ATP-dependent sacrificial sulfur transferase LarE, partial [Terriglobia bacterium]